MTSELKQLLENIKRDALRVRDLADYKCPDPRLGALWGPMDRIVGVVAKALNQSPSPGPPIRISVDGQVGDLPPGRCTGADIKNAADVPRSYQLFRGNGEGEDYIPVADNQWIVPVHGEKFYAVPPATGA